MLKISLSFLSLCFSLLVSAQSAIEYFYDGAGNRIRRQELVVGGGGSKLRSVTDTIIHNVANHNVTVYPNPLKENIKLDITGELSNGYEVYIADYSGREVYRKSHQKPNKQINLSYLKKGIYLMRVNIDQQFFELKLIKQ